MSELIGGAVLQAEPPVLLKIFNSQWFDAHELAPQMQPGVIDELAAVGIDDLVGSTLEAFTVSAYSRAAYVGPDIAAVWGLRVMSITGGVGMPWALTSSVVTQHPKTFLEISRIEVARMLAITPRLRVMVDARFKAAHRWMRKLGFALSGPGPYGPLGSDHYLATMEYSDV